MSSGASVRAIQALDDMKGSLNRFAGEAREALQATEQEIHRTQDWLQERLNHWRNEVQRRQEEVRRAEAALAHCLASGYHDRDGYYHAPDCSAYERAVFQARARLQEAEAEMQNSQRWMKAVGDAAVQYRAQARHLQALVTAHAEKAQAFLGRKITDLERYVALASGVGAFGPAFVNALRSQYQTVRTRVGQRAVELAKQQEIELVQGTGRGTRDWRRLELRQVKRGQFPKGYHGHHINNVQRFPDLAANPNNIKFVTWKEHLRLHHGAWRNNTSGKMFNRKSLMVQWAKDK